MRFLSREPAKFKFLWEFSGIAKALIRIKETNQGVVNKIFSFLNNVCTVCEFGQWVSDESAPNYF